MTKKIAGAVAATAAAIGLLVAGTGVANAADPSCLVASLNGAAADPVGALNAFAADPVAALQADAACVQQVIGG
ncbi:MAG: hypothetical protein L0H84_24345 [Pseudonocardia sp.]|nr:hypothetical protein [Pseudonocardia sp.]